MRDQNHALVCVGRVPSDGHDVGVHLVDVHLAEALFCQFAVQQIQRALARNDAAFVVDTLSPLLVLAFLVDHVNLKFEEELLQSALE